MCIGVKAHVYCLFMFAVGMEMDLSELRQRALVTTIMTGPLLTFFGKKRRQATRPLDQQPRGIFD